MQRIREWRHPLMQSLLEMLEGTRERLKSYCMHPHHSVGIGGHLRGTLDRWLI